MSLPFRLLLSALLLLHGVAMAAQADRRERTEADLQRINSQIERVRRQVQQDAVERDRMSRDLRAAEQSVSSARGEVEKLRSERAERNAALAQLAADRAAREAERERTRDSLASQLRAAYFMGRNEPLKLLLNQRNPAEFGRNIAYYGYFGRLRASEIDAINRNLAEIDEIKARIEEEEAELRRLEEARAQRLSELESARTQRGRVLAKLEQETRNRSASLKRMEQQQAQLERLLRDLNRALESSPVDPNDAFAKLRGKLAWPVAGTLTATYGQTRAGAVRWNGLLIKAERGQPVKAVHDGRVIYADWLPGMGLLIIIDHGNGYLSLYGHNETLFRQSGAAVRAGETISAAGDSGGRAESGLYFEIRRSGKPVDPRPWFRSQNPPNG
ncbi:MAG: peptidoglycan DD-metalloendopeptidase family protein [Steroidobacteraceae bacterium]